MTDSAHPDAEECPNVLLICVDCLREDLLRGDRTETPFMASLRESGLSCEQTFASATTTTPAVASLLSGLYAERNGIYSLDRGSLSSEAETLATVLGERGYTTVGLATGPLVPETGLDRGFDKYECRDESASVFGPWRAEALAELEALEAPFFAFVHLWELHEKITVPSAYDRPDYGELPYERALSALDPAIGDLVEAVPSDTIVALVGDHGESITHRHNPLRLGVKSLRDGLRYYLGIDTRGVVSRLNRRLDGWGPDIDDHFIENGHGENVFDFTANVPFVLTGPDIEAATVTEQVRQVDIAPTILDHLGIDLEADGRPIDSTDGVEDRPAYLRACGASLHRERNWAVSIRHDGAKYVAYPDRRWSPELYDVRADPRELTRIDDPDLQRRLRGYLPGERTDLSSVETLDIEERLEQLGYR